MTDLNDRERLALALALEKACKRLTDTRDPDNLRGGIDTEAKALFVNNDVTQSAFMVRGKKVGTISARLSKGGEAVEPVIERYDDLIQWLTSTDGGAHVLGTLLAKCHRQLTDAVSAYVTATGELPDGIRMDTRHEEPAWLGTTVRVDSEKVAEAFAGELAPAVAGLLGAGE